MRTYIYSTLIFFLHVFYLNSISAQIIYKEVTSIDEINNGGIFIIARLYDKMAMGEIIKKNGASVGRGINITDINETEDIIFIEQVNTDTSPYEIEIQKDSENNGLFYLKTKQGYLYSETSTSIEYSETYNKNKKYKWGITIGNTNNHFAKILNNSSNRIINYISSSKDFRAEGGTDPKANIQLFRKSTVPLQIGTAKYSTLYYSDKNLVVPDGVEAYTFKYNDGLQISKTYKYPDIIPANTAVVLHGHGNYEFIETVADGIADESNVLKGTDNKEDISSDDSDYYLYYMLSLNSANELSSVGFYWGADGGGPFINNAHKAYLMIPKHNDSSSKSSFLFSDITSDNTTDISHPIKHETSDFYYTIQGNRISHPVSKGIYIFKGKKRIITK